ncbi:MAG TPA: tyrosine-type recombinase/integrase, partial [Myxococcota bacterium]|nr:tyrosine-type recombinase/integrase [Myxococcota bacterium]
MRPRAGDDRPAVEDGPSADSPGLALVDRWLDHLRAERGRSVHTLRGYGATTRGLIGALAARGIAVERATRADLRRWLFEVARGSSSVARHVAAVRTFYAWLQREGRVERSPAATLKPPRVGSSLPHVPQEAPLGAMLDRIEEQQERAALELLYGAGLRVSEAVALDVDDVDLDGGLVHVRHGKGDRERRVPMGAAAIAALRAWLEVRPAAPHAALFVGRR